MAPTPLVTSITSCHRAFLSYPSGTLRAIPPFLRLPVKRWTEGHFERFKLTLQSNLHPQVVIGDVYLPNDGDKDTSCLFRSSAYLVTLANTKVEFEELAKEINKSAKEPANFWIGRSLFENNIFRHVFLGLHLAGNPGGEPDASKLALCGFLDPLLSKVQGVSKLPL